jgi:hypothetical protein
VLHVDRRFDDKAIITDQDSIGPDAVAAVFNPIDAVLKPLDLRQEES